MSDFVYKEKEGQVLLLEETGFITCSVANTATKDLSALKVVTTTGQSLEMENGEACMLHHTEMTKATFKDVSLWVDRDTGVV